MNSEKSEEADAAVVVAEAVEGVVERRYVGWDLGEVADDLRVVVCCLARDESRAEGGGGEEEWEEGCGVHSVYVRARWVRD